MDSNGEWKLVEKSLQTVLDEKAAAEERSDIHSSLTDRLRVFLAQAHGCPLSSATKIQIVSLAEGILQWRNEQKTISADGEKAIGACMMYVSQLLGSQNEQVFHEALSFWGRRIDQADMRLEPFRESILGALNKRLNSWEAIKVYIYFRLSTAQRRNVRLILQKDGANAIITGEQKWAALGRLGDSASRERLATHFRKCIQGREVYTDGKEFRKLESLVSLVGYSDREQCPVALFDSLSSEVQLATLNGNASIRISVLNAMEKHFPSPFAHAFKMRVSAWIARNATPSLVIPNPTQLPQCKDKAALRRFESFCEGQFGKKPWNVENVWFKCTRVIPNLPAGFHGKLPTFHVMTIGTARKMSVYHSASGDQE